MQSNNGTWHELGQAGMNESATPLKVSEATGFGDWAVAAHGFSRSTSHLILTLHWIGLALILVTLPPHALAFHELFIVRRKSVFGKLLPNNSSHSAVIATLPRFAQPLARMLLAPSRLRPMPTEVMVLGFTIITPFDIGWHVVLLGDIGPLALRHILLCAKIMISQATLQLNLIGTIMAIPSVGAAAFSNHSTQQSLPSSLTSNPTANGRTRTAVAIQPSRASLRIRKAIMDLRVPSPMTLTISLYVFLFVHVPLITKLAIFKTSTKDRDEAVREHTALWSAWAVWLALFGISAIVYGVQLMSVLSANEADRREASAFKGQLMSTTVGAPAIAATQAIGPRSPISHSSKTSSSNGSAEPRPTGTAPPPPPSSKQSVTALVADSVEAQRRLALAQVRSIILTSPLFALVYSAINILNLFAFRALQHYPAVMESWLWIIPAAMHILVQGLAHVDAFCGLAFVIWRERRKRILGELVGNSVRGG